MPPPQPTRAPALYVTGLSLGPGETGPRPSPRLSAARAGELWSGLPLVTLRLPLPPIWEGRVEGVAAAERRARKAYFAALDAMRWGRDAAGEAAARVGKLQRFLTELRADTARVPLMHLMRIWRAVDGATEAPLLPPPPPAPLTAVVVHVPRTRGVGVLDPAALEERYAWALEWLRTRAYLASRRELRLEWRVVGPG